MIGVCVCVFFCVDQTIVEEPSMLQSLSMEGSRTTLDESLMPPPSRQRGVKRKSQEPEAALPVSLKHGCFIFSTLFPAQFLLHEQEVNGTFLFQTMSILDQSVPPPMEPSVLSQQLDMPQVDLPPEDSANLSRMVPELDLLGEKSKDKEDSEEEEEVSISLGPVKGLA